MLRFIMKLFKYDYLLNKRSNEVHNLNNPQHNCHTDLIKDKKYLSERQMKIIVNTGADGCRWCMPEENKDD